jgi:hypothetical protein
MSILRQGDTDLRGSDGLAWLTKNLAESIHRGGFGIRATLFWKMFFVYIIMNARGTGCSDGASGLFQDKDIRFWRNDSFGGSIQKEML